MLLPRLYAILDTACFSDSQSLLEAAEELAAGGVTLLQYRNKSGSARQMLEQARELKRRVDDRVTLIMNDRADLCLAAEFDGLHVGQDDLSPEAARRIIGGSGEMISDEARRVGPQGLKPDSHANPGGTAKAVPFHESIDVGGYHVRWLGVSTHNPEQLRLADQTTADYLAIGPVFATSSKASPDPAVGLEGVRRARELTQKPLVAIGGITRANARSVIDAGADSVAVISDLLRETRKSAEEFLRVLG